MRVTIIPSDGFCAVDGYGLQGVDMAGVAANVHAVQFDNGHGVVENKDRTHEIIDSISQFQAIVDRHAAMKAEIEARSADPFYGMTSQQAVAAAVSSRLHEVEQQVMARQLEDIVVGGVRYYADSWATKTIESAVMAANALGLGPTDPVRVPPPLQPGYWLTADIHGGGNRVAAPMNVGQLRELAVALYDRNGAIWGKGMIIGATLQALPAMGLTAAQIMAYDISGMW